MGRARQVSNYAKPKCTWRILALFPILEQMFITVAHVLREDALGKCNRMAGVKT
jgi:hypothetical protein